MFQPNDKVFADLVNRISEHILTMKKEELYSEQAFCIYNKWKNKQSIEIEAEYIPLLLDYIEELQSLDKSLINLRKKIHS